MFVKANRTKTELKWWPSPQDYNEAIQNPQLNLHDEELQNGLVYLDERGIPRPISGAFASVYRLKCKSRDLALRCFLRDVADQETRYCQISDFVQNDDSQLLVTFDYLKQGIKIFDKWVPVLKMEWVEGWTLDHYLYFHRSNKEMLRSLARKFLEMMDRLNKAGIAHGDLQHANIIVLPNNELRLVDYDAMFVPSMKGMCSNELGHMNYQHPLRKAEHFDQYLDNFSAWVIYASIIGLEIDPQLWKQLGAGDDCLLFRKSDFGAAHLSPAFAAFERHENPSLQKLGMFLRDQAKKPLESCPQLIPALAETHESPDLIPIDRNCPTYRDATLSMGTQTNWLNAENSSALTRAGVTDSMPAQEYVGLPHWVANFTSTNHKVYKLEPELRTPSPRRVKFNYKEGDPFVLQFIAIINPLFWSGIISFQAATTDDVTLGTFGVDYPGYIQSIVRIDSRNGPTYEASFNYWVGGKLYQGIEKHLEPGQLHNGKSIYVHALPSNPEIRETLFEPPGTKSFRDWSKTLFSVAVCTTFECLIWIPVLLDWLKSRFGSAVLGQVENKEALEKKHGKFTYVEYSVFVSYTVPKFGTVQRRVKLTEKQYSTLKVGDIVSILYNPSVPEFMVLYQFCRFKCVQ